MDDELLQDIEFIVLIAVCLLLFICNIGNFTGAFGAVLRGAMFGAFGFFAYLFPVALFAFGFLRLAKRRVGFLNIPLRNEIAAGVLCVVMMIASEFISGHPEENETFSIVEICARSVDIRGGGGAIGGSLAYLLNYFLSRVGSILLLIGITAVCLVILTNKAIIRLAANGSRRAAEAAGKQINRAYSAGREMEQNRRELRHERELERMRLEEERDTERILRKDRVTTGIGDTTIAAPSGEEQSDKREEARDYTDDRRTRNDNMHPIYLDEDLQDMEVRINNGDGAASYEEEGASEVYPVRRSDEMHEIGLSNGSYGSRAQSGSGVEAVSPVAENGPDRADSSAGYTARNEVREEAPVSSSGQRVSQEMAPVSVNRQNAKPTVERSRKRQEQKKPVREESRKIDPSGNGGYAFPPIDLLKAPGNKGGESRASIEETARNLERTLETFGVKAKVTDMSQGPAVTRYELHLAEGVKVNSITKLSDDIKLSLAATDVRIEAPIPGKSAVGIEVPNKVNTAVSLREMLETEEFRNAKSRLSFVVGKDISGKPVVTDMEKMPHLLIAGATGSGKSVCINTIIMSILYKARPDEVKLMMIDPKVVELSVYNGIPHLVAPVITDAKKAAGALNWAVSEMEDRYKRLADAEVRNIEGYNALVESEKNLPDNERIHTFMPHMVIIVDELADLMMVARSDVEGAIIRLTQLARAAGMHLIVATQRPSVDVITGLIKANVPSRIAFAVSSVVDSRTILDMGGAEKLLGKGDMLFFPRGMSRPARVQGAFVSDKEVSDVTGFIKDNTGTASYDENIQKAFEKGSPKGSDSGGGDSDGATDVDEYFPDAGRLLIERKKGSIGLIQRAFKLGFNRAARIMDQLEEHGVVGPDNGTSKGREILMSIEDFEALLDELGV